MNMTGRIQINYVPLTNRAQYELKAIITTPMPQYLHKALRIATFVFLHSCTSQLLTKQQHQMAIIVLFRPGTEGYDGTTAQAYSETLIQSSDRAASSPRTTNRTIIYLFHPFKITLLISSAFMVTSEIQSNSVIASSKICFVVTNERRSKRCVWQK